ncbi:unnamed protein product [Arctogadus glacialis]
MITLRAFHYALDDWHPREGLPRSPHGAASPSCTYASVDRENHMAISPDGLFSYFFVFLVVCLLNWITLRKSIWRYPLNRLLFVVVIVLFGM